MINKYPAIAFICIAILPIYIILGICWIIGVPLASLKPLKILFALTPLLSLFIVGTIFKGINLEKVFSKFFNRSTPYFWYILACLFIPLLGFIAMCISSLAFVNSISWNFPSWSRILGLSIPLLIFPGLTEEFAWRGYLFDHLRAKQSLGVASIIVGGVWGTWHCFDFIIGNWTFTIPLFCSFILYLISISIIICYLYEKSGQNITIAILTHFSANALISFTPLWRSGTEAVFIFIGFLILGATILVLLSGKDTRPYNTPN